MNICHRYLGIELSEKISCLDVWEEEKGEKFLETIFKFGVFGRKDVTNSIANQIAYDKEEQKTGTLRNIRKVLTYVFPTGKRLAGPYAYAQKYPILTPIAWIHRVIRIIFKKEYTLKEKASMAIKTTVEANERAQLFQWLEI